jgi:uncharacterized protein (TIGR02271 family)
MPYSALSQHTNAQFPEGLADVRGYEVRTRLDDEKVGKVEDLVCEADGSIRYLDVDLGGFFNTKHVLLPVGAAEIDARDNIVWLSGMSKQQVKDMPDYTGDLSTVDGDYSTRARSFYGSDVADDDLYDQGRFYANRGPADARERRLVLSEEQLDIQKRQVQAGEVSVRKTVETEHVRETVPVMHEEVTIERHAIAADDARALDRADIGEQEIRVPLMAEEVRAEKRVVPTEEVVVRTRDVTEERVIEEDLRRERADVDDSQRGVRGSGLVADRTLADRDADGLTDVDDRAGGATRRAGNRAANALDDLKDRVDGNPASRPGPDATDRR